MWGVRISLFVLFVTRILLPPPGLSAADYEAVWDFYRDGPLNSHRVASWNMAHEERPGGGTADGVHLWFNDDWNARPWAMAVLRDGAGMELTEEWMERGFVRFLVNAGMTRYGQPAGNIALQVKVHAEGGRFRKVNASHIERGRGVDEDPASWQEVMIPLSYWEGLRAGAVVTGLSVQTQYQPERSFGIDEVQLVRFDTLPDWVLSLRDPNVLQAGVVWPALEELPEALRADLAPPRVENGRFVGPDGRRVFVINPYVREVSGQDLWGPDATGADIPVLDLYDPEAHGWIYNELLTAGSLSRLGFNSISVTMPESPWNQHLLRTVEGMQTHPDLHLGAPPSLEALRDRVGLPFHVDTVCWPWSLGNAAVKGLLPEDFLTRGKHHWTYFRIIGKGRRLWLDLWDLYASRYAAAGVPVLTFELMNEPAYMPETEDHHAEFADWLRTRYESLDALNSTWQSRFDSWESASRFTGSEGVPDVPGQYLDYDEYVAGRFVELIRDGAAVVKRHLPDTLTGLQTMGDYTRNPREGIWKHRIVEHESVVLAPTGGGSWTGGAAARKPSDALMQHPMAAAPMEADLVLALAGEKMIFDNETYLRGQTRRDTFHRLWEHVICGLDALTVFNWSKRGWEWEKGRGHLADVAERFPFAALNPFARRTDALRGIHDFSASIQPIAADILPKPWGPRARIAFLYSWADARWRNVQRKGLDKRGAYYAALKYAHWNMSLLPSDRALEPDGLDGFDVVVLADIQNLEEGLPERLRAFVEAGGVLVAGECTFHRNPYNLPLDTRGLSVTTPAVTRERIADDPGAVLSFQQEPSLLPGTFPVRQFLSLTHEDWDTSVLAGVPEGEAALLRRPLGGGFVYYQQADVIGYPLAKLLAAALEDAARRKGMENADPWRLATIRENGRLAPNILLSRRSHAQDARHVLLMQNRDTYRRTIQVALPVEADRWTVEQPVGGGGDGKPVPAREKSGSGVAGTGVPVTLEGEAPAVLILRPEAAPAPSNH